MLVKLVGELMQNGHDASSPQSRRTDSSAQEKQRPEKLEINALNIEKSAALTSWKRSFGELPLATPCFLPLVIRMNILQVCPKRALWRSFQGPSPLKPRIVCKTQSLSLNANLLCLEKGARIVKLMPSWKARNPKIIKSDSKVTPGGRL